MNGRYRIFDFYLNSSIHVGFSVISLVGITYLSLGIFPEIKLIAFVFFATITGYNFIKYAGVAKWHHRSLTKSLKIIQVFSFFAFLAMGYFASTLSFKTLKYTFVLGLLTALYILPVFSRKRNLRSLKGLKIYSIALVWAGVTVILPIVQNEVLLDWNIYVIGIQRFLFVIALTIPFEIRDLKYDQAELGTLPQVLGVRQTKKLGVLLTLIFSALTFFIDSAEWSEWLGILIITVLLLQIIIKLKEKQSKYYASFRIESLPILWVLILIVLRLFTF